MASKSLFLSRTFWFNLVSGLLLALLPAFPVLKPAADWLSGNSVVVASIWSVLAIGLRLATKDAVHLVD